jgi:hypothetical protein
MAAEIPPIIRLIDRSGNAVDGNTLPMVGRKPPESSLPVTLAKGMDLVQSSVSVPQWDQNNATNSIKKVLEANPDRRYIKIVNNGAYDIELWNSSSPPNASDVAQTVSKGELLKPGAGIAETDTCRTNAIYATSINGVSGLLVLVG